MTARLHALLARLAAWLHREPRRDRTGTYPEDQIDAAVDVVRTFGAAAVPDGSDPVALLKRLTHAAWIWRTGVCPDCAHDECIEAGDALVVARAVVEHATTNHLEEIAR